MTDRKQILAARLKWAIAAVACIAVAPFVFLLVQGIVGLAIAAAAVGAAAIAAAPVVAMKLANWKLQGLKAEARQNPIESRQNLALEARERIRLADAELTLLTAASVFAQQLQVSTGAAKGSTYTDMFATLGKYCGSQLALVPMPSSGSVENLDRLTSNTANAAFVQSDMLFMRAVTEDLGGIKTLLALHPETVHFVAPARSGLKSGGMLGVGGQEVVIQDIGQLAGLRVGAAGGSVVTAKVVKLQSDIGYTLMEYGDTGQLLKALADGEINAAILVGGAPLGSVAGLPAGYKLLAVPPAVAEKLKNVYRPIRANYRNLGAAGVPTIATDALLVARSYKTPKMVEALARFRQCALASLDEIKETTGTHPAWQQVKADNRGLWPWYELPAAVAAKR